MGSTRHSTSLSPIRIFNDSFGTDQPSHFNPSSPLDNAPSLQPAGNVLAPRRDTNSRSIPPAQAGRSPSKSGGRKSSPPLKHALSNTPDISFPTPRTGQATDSLVKKPSPSTLSFGPRSAHQTGPMLLPLSDTGNKENAYPALSSDNFAEFPGPGHVSKGLNKRPLMDESPHDGRASKAARVTTAPLRIPQPHEMPDIVDDGKKPRYTYAQLCAMAILRSPNRQLTLSSIYEWISKTFVHYRESAAVGGWQNSIRHNLSLHKAFQKAPRPRNDPGKGHYWVIDVEHIADFLNEKSARRPASSSNTHRPSSRPSSSQGPLPPGPALAPMQTPVQSQHQHQHQHQQNSTMNRPVMQPPLSRGASASVVPDQKSNKAGQAAEPSSDATIPLSDPALLEEDGDEPTVDIARPSSRARQSSPQPPMHSSPPIPPARSRASTGAGNDLLSSSHGSKRRKRASMNDSGYYSSLESSAMRRPQSRAGLDTLAAGPKRGRAEDEIRRLRSSSQDISPSKAPYLGVPRHSTPGLASSSPTRPLDQPLTPGLASFDPRPVKSNKKVKIVAPALSPDTQLANHRNKVNELIGTPKADANAKISAIPWSLDFIGDAYTPPQNSISGHHFDESRIFTPDIGFDMYGDDQSPIRNRRSAFQSPSKMIGSAGRPSFLRSNTTPAKALGDITNIASNRPTPAGLKPPVRFTSRLGSPLRFGSPEKGAIGSLKNVADEGPPLTSSPLKNLFAEFRSPMKFDSPVHKLPDDVFSYDPSKLLDITELADTVTLDLFADDDEGKTCSPRRDATASLSTTSLDLAGNFQKIGSEAAKNKENVPAPSTKGRKTGNKARPALGRSSTSFL